MKRWAVLTVLIYALALVLMAMPVIVIAFSGKQTFSLKMAATVYVQWEYWLWLAVLVGGQALLLLLPIDIAGKRLPARRNLKIPIIVGGFFLGNLVLTGALSIISVIYGDNIPDYYDLDHDLGGGAATPLGGLSTGILTLLFFWLGWMILFRRFASRDDPDSLIKRVTRWLLRGGILELLGAVPTHV